MNNYQVKVIQENTEICNCYISASNACEAVELGFSEGALFMPSGHAPFTAIVLSASGLIFTFELGRFSYS